MSKKEKAAVTQEISVLSRLAVRAGRRRVWAGRGGVGGGRPPRRLPQGDRRAWGGACGCEGGWKGARVQCPNIVGYIDAFQERGSLCIVMEYADGGACAGGGWPGERRRAAAEGDSQRVAQATWTSSCASDAAGC
jgi:hypothetical protein